GSIPDALASTAHYLQRAGWQTGRHWGHEVQLPPGFDASLAGRTKRRPLQEWLALGVRRIDGGELGPADARAAILLPAGRTGPAFLVFRNYDAIYAYNAAESYALAIATLADRLRGGPGLATPWPTNDPGLSRAQRRELQQLLLARGHPIGEPDGLVRTRTRQAIADEQRRLGMNPVVGRTDQRILGPLRNAYARHWQWHACTAPPCAPVVHGCGGCRPLPAKPGPVGRRNAPHQRKHAVESGELQV